MVKGSEAGRLSPQLLSDKAEQYLQSTLGTPGARARWVEGTSVPWIYLNRDLLRQRGLSEATVQDQLAAWLARQPGVLKAYTRTPSSSGARRLTTRSPAASAYRFTPTAVAMCRWS